MIAAPIAGGIAALAVALVFGLAGDARGDAMRLTSEAFQHDGAIPKKYTCDGDDVSPPLSWSSVPAKAKSLALVVDDPDAPDPAAPRPTWVHWVVYNLPADSRGLSTGAAGAGLPDGAREGLNDWKRKGYGGPCPPTGRHRYVHKLYALDVVLTDLDRPTKAELTKAMRGHIVGEAVIIGTYER